MLYDRGSDFIMVDPMARRTTEETEDAFRKWEGPPEAGNRVQSSYPDNAPELERAGQAITLPNVNTRRPEEQRS